MSGPWLRLNVQISILRYSNIHISSLQQLLMRPVSDFIYAVSCSCRRNNINLPRLRYVLPQHTFFHLRGISSVNVSTKSLLLSSSGLFFERLLKTHWAIMFEKMSNKVTSYWLSLLGVFEVLIDDGSVYFTFRFLFMVTSVSFISSCWKKHTIVYLLIYHMNIGASPLYTCWSC